jgi:hypothetical protein
MAMLATKRFTISTSKKGIKVTKKNKPTTAKQKKK